MRPPEIGQIIHNNPVGYKLPEYVTALMFHIRREIGRVYSNVNQKPWPGDPDFEWWDLDDAERTRYPAGDLESIDVPEMEWHGYYNWGGSPDDPDWDQAKANRPNFSFRGVEIRWYKRFGRSMNTNTEHSPDKWVEWFNAVMDALDVYGERQNELAPEEVIPENAPHRCPICGKHFHWPASRCGYDGTPLIRVLKRQ